MTMAAEEKRKDARRKDDRRTNRLRTLAKTKQETWAKNGLNRLSKIDADYGSVNNEIGFDWDRRDLGHWLNKRTEKGLTPYEWGVARAICRYYPSQIGKEPQE